jgi:hypothetical protein
LKPGGGLACRGQCEEEVKALDEFVHRGMKRGAVNEQIAKAARQNRYLNAAYYLCFGLLLFGFVGYRYVSTGAVNPAEYLFVAMGIFLCVFGLIAFVRARKFPKITS